MFPLSIRGKGVALATASNWFNNCMCLTVCYSLSATLTPVSPVLIGLITPVLIELSAVYVLISYQLTMRLTGKFSG